MSEVLRPPCAELLEVADVIDQMIARYRLALRSATIGRWEAPLEAVTIGWLVIRNVEAVLLMARYDEVLVTASWPNARVAFELSARIVWMLQPGDRYEAECRWLALLGDWEKIERQLAQEASDDVEFHTKWAEQIREFREGVASKLPSGYHPAKLPRNFREMLSTLDTPQMYRVYREGSQYIHGSMYASSRYGKNLGSYRTLGDFTSTFDWILPMRICWLSLREAARFILDRLDVQDRDMPNWDELNCEADATFQELATYCTRSPGNVE